MQCIEHSAHFIYVLGLYNVFSSFHLLWVYLQSPFPEEKGYVIPLRETQRLNQLSDIRKSLSFSGLELASPALKSPVATHLSPPSTINQSVNERESHPSSAAVLKPSNVVELQKHVSSATAKQKRKSDIDPVGSTVRLGVANQGTYYACNHTTFWESSWWQWDQEACE